MTDNNELVLLYAAQGQADLITKVMGKCSNFMLENALDTAAEYGHVDCVKALVSVCKVQISQAMWEACHAGHVRVIEVLLSNGFSADCALGDCMEFQNFDCFEVLAQHSDVHDFRNAFFRSFELCNQDHAEEGRKILAGFCAVNMIGEILHGKSAEGAQQVVEWLNDYVSKQQREILNNSIQMPTDNKKIRRV